MLTNATDASDAKNAPLPSSIARSTRTLTEPAPGKGTMTRRRRDKQEGVKAGAEERYFLAEGDSKADVPSLGREFGSEAEAIIEAFRAKVNFYRVTEFQTRADIGKAGEPILKKEALKKTTPAS